MSSPYVLSLDIGANSVGWACMACDENGDATGFLPGPTLGSHVFDAGVDNYFGSGQGKEESRGAKRRAARMMRRQLQRRARRVAKTYNILAQGGLLPPLDVPPFKEGSSSARREYEMALSRARDAVIKALDVELGRKLAVRDAALASQALEHLPYVLRARALDHKLEAYELGRALFHLAQRRGFKSARKGGSKESDEERSKVLSAIKSLRESLDTEGKDGKARTLGEHFLRMTQEERRVRGNWTGRRMYQDEFAAIWRAQQPHHPDLLTESLRERLVGKKGDGGAIFHQRPLKLQEHLIGVCDIYDGVKRKPERKRAPWASLEAQRFRMLQKVNDLRIIDEDKARTLTDTERARLIAVLEINRRLSLKNTKDEKELNVRKVLNLGKKARFNFGRDQDDDLPEFLPGNRTAADLCGIFGENKWRSWTPQQQAEIVDACWRIDAPGALAALAIEKWGATADQAHQLEEEFSLEDDYCGLSREAMRELLPLMEAGKPYVTARREVFGEDPPPPMFDLLPPVKQFLPTLRNPVVSRALTEIRRVVNAVIRRYGKPALVRIELAREMKKSAKQRDAILKANKQREKERRQAAEKIVRECKDLYRSADDVKPWDIEKVLLWDECGGICPYTGQSISFCDLFGQRVDVEHIIPYSRSLDNSFNNKTLCFSEENRNVKKRQTPFETYGHTDKWPLILRRVAKFDNKEKLRRFELHGEALNKFLDDFTNAQLVNTAYAARLSLDYLGTLYGLPSGQSHIKDASGRQRIQVCNGRLTYLFRAAWGLNEILGDGNFKKRVDHRHHAVDAVCIGLTTVKMRQALEKQVAEFERRRPPGSNRQFSLRKGDVPPPWGEFKDGVEQRIRGCNVSHRVDKKVSGAIHDESLYSPRRNEQGEPDPKGAYSHIRKPVESVTDPDDIVDPATREAVKKKLAQIGDPKKLADDPPKMPSGVPIRRVRIRKKNKTTMLGDRGRERFVELGSNHHVEIIQKLDNKGRPKWEMRFVSTLEAYQREKAKRPVVDRTVGPDEEFICSLVGGDAFLWEAEDGKPEVFRVRTLDSGGCRIAAVRNQDARKKGEILSANKDSLKQAKASGRERPASEKHWFQPSAEVLREGRFQKVTVTPLGEVRPVND